MLCPFCNAPLPDDAVQCNQCDWVQPPPAETGHGRDLAAAVMSAVPGLGHLYKGHIALGFVILVAAGPALLGLVAVLVPGTLGLSLLLLPIFMAAVAFHAFHAEDIRARVPEMFAEVKPPLEQADT